MTQEKDYTLLRPFDLEAAKRGEEICWCDGDSVQYVAGPDNKGEVAYFYEGGLFTREPDYIRMAPLAWVEGRPVYKGDVLYYRTDGETATVESLGREGKLVVRVPNTGLCSEDTDTLTWTPPKPKTKQVKLLAHLDADQLFWLRETAQAKWPSVRVPSEDKTIEVEE